MSDMAKPLGLFRRKPSPIWYYRVRIPSDLVQAFDGKAELKVSLKTTDYAQAKRTRDRVAVTFNDLFASKRTEARRKPVSTSLTKAEITALVRRYVTGTDAKHAAEFPTQDWFSDPTSIEEALEHSHKLITCYADPSELNTLQDIDFVERCIFGSDGLPSSLSRDNASFAAELIRRAMIEVERRFIARLTSDHSRASYDGRHERNT
jgi:hypothetical protein